MNARQVLTRVIIACAIIDAAVYFILHFFHA